VSGTGFALGVGGPWKALTAIMTDGKKAILVVDDEQNIRLMLRSTLEGAGYAVREAGGAREAIAAIERDAPHGVLLDLWMPGDHGMTVLESMKDWPAEKRPRVIVLTAHGGVTDCVKAMRLGAADFLEKPMTPESLRKSVDAALGDPESKAATPPPLPERSRRRDVSYSPVLVHIQQAIWNSDIHRTEQTLAECFRRASKDPVYYNVLGVAFEAEGNREAARTFYQKAATGNCEAALQNLKRLDELEQSGTSQTQVALGEQARFVEKLCAQTQILQPGSGDENETTKPTNRSNGQELEP
jgi:DNA-binding response OmpR family regulator